MAAGGACGHDCSIEGYPVRWTTPGGMAVAVNWRSQPLRNFSHRDLSSAIRNGAESSVITPRYHKISIPSAVEAN